MSITRGWSAAAAALTLAFGVSTPAVGSSPKAGEKAAAGAPAPALAPAPAPATKPAEVAAKTLFGAQKTAAPLEARAIGFYSRGCLAGAKPLPVDGPAWQAMRLSRNRNWGHPQLISWIEHFARAAQLDGWPGLLVGDIAQPRGGPMLTGHASHQLGLDVDIWFTPMPDRRLSAQEREDLSATSMLADGGLAVNPQVWTERHVKVIRRAASDGQIERVLVHPAIKKALCEATPAGDRAWLAKVRPYWGHHYHFHVRMGCPADSPECKGQQPVGADDGCGKEIEDWYALLTAPPKPAGKPTPPKPPLTLADLPAECRVVLDPSTSSPPAATAAQ